MNPSDNMNHLFTLLIGEQIFVYIKGGMSFSGKLLSYNGFLLHLDTTGCNIGANQYICAEDVSAIGSDK